MEEQLKQLTDLVEHLKQLQTESAEKSIYIEQVNTEKVISLFLADYMDTIPLIDKVRQQIKFTIDACTLAVQNGGSVLYVGSGTSGRLGVLDASECPPTFGVDANVFRGIIAGGDGALRNSIEGAEDDVSKAFFDYRDNNITAKDVVIGISASGRTPYVLEFLKEHKNNGGKTVFLACNHKTVSEVPMVDILIALNVGKELLAGSTRLKSGTVTKIILNMISTITMINLGKVYKNYMVDLKATNSKLKARVVKTFVEITNEPIEKAKEILDIADFQLKTALVIYFKKITKKEAEELLRERNGYLKYII